MSDPEALFELPATAAQSGPSYVDLRSQALEELVHRSWVPALTPVEPALRRVLERLAAEEAAAPCSVLPAASAVFAAFALPLENVKVLIVGQDPYPTPGHAMGLSFSVNGSVRPLPRSLNNIYKELSSDLGIHPPAHGDLSGWSRQGVLLLNRTLTVRSGAAASHRSLGWDEITTAAVIALATRLDALGHPLPLVSVLWGKDAQQVLPLVNEFPSVVSAHPSPLSASRGFFGSKPFSRVNELLELQGAAPVSWELT
ncbi:uracil-DNA glycosylase [Pseudarthrobacter sp. J1738]|uniref:uracil-DNA glycosylase n=1 Tax=unclassified Pseudarthrobacter TaxID=2647000 RepID=UPI003D276FF1